MVCRVAVKGLTAVGTVYRQFSQTRTMVAETSGEDLAVIWRHTGVPSANT